MINHRNQSLTPSLQALQELPANTNATSLP